VLELVVADVLGGPGGLGALAGGMLARVTALGRSGVCVLLHASSVSRRASKLCKGTGVARTDSVSTASSPGTGFLGKERHGAG
jgi:hypothetical protein